MIADSERCEAEQAVTPSPRVGNRTAKTWEGKSSLLSIPLSLSPFKQAPIVIFLP